jgi:hypothetical protein
MFIGAAALFEIPVSTLIFQDEKTWNYHFVLIK